MPSRETPEPVGPREPITRFLRNSGYFAPEAKRVKPEGLLPPPIKDGRTRLETSVYRTDRVHSAEIWAMCTEHVDRPKHEMKARGTVAASAFMQRGLAFDPDGKPHPRHANVIEWPTEKHAQKNLAREIADEMTLEVRPPSTT